MKNHPCLVFQTISLGGIDKFVYNSDCFEFKAVLNYGLKPQNGMMINFTPVLKFIIELPRRLTSNNTVPLPVSVSVPRLPFTVICHLSFVHYSLRGAMNALNFCKICHPDHARPRSAQVLYPI